MKNKPIASTSQIDVVFPDGIDIRKDYRGSMQKVLKVRYGDGSTTYFFDEMEPLNEFEIRYVESSERQLRETRERLDEARRGSERRNEAFLRALGLYKDEIISRA